MPATGAAARWSRSTDVARNACLALSVFPLDPELPTLPLVTDPAYLHSLDPFAGSLHPPNVTVAHHPRHGACVLRYRLRRSPAHALNHPPAILYGKVYGNTNGDVVDGFLRALLSEQSRLGGRYPTNYPRPVAYDPQLRLLLTEGLPGKPRVPELLKGWLRGSAGDRSVPEELRQALRQSARALAALHGSDLTTAPVHLSSQEVAGIEQELHVVRGVWPQEAERIMAGFDGSDEPGESSMELVLSHGDFTPAQVLLEEGVAPAVVDLDTLCWAEPALDLGRYLAQLRLLVIKVGGPAARGSADELGDEFLRCYGRVSDRAAAAAQASDRIAFYLATTLARSALHSCRQLKPDRYELAVSLLEDIQARRVDL